jgi:hypothetical protein
MTKNPCRSVRYEYDPEVPHCDDIVVVLYMKIKGLIEIFVDELTPVKLIIGLMKNLLNLVIIGPSYGMSCDMARILLLLIEMIGNIINIRKLMKSLLMNKRIN